MVIAVERVRERLRRATGALEAAGVPHAVVGGNAVAAWVATVDPSAVRNTQDVDILIRREDMTGAEAALEKVGFSRRHAAGIDFFQDGDGSRFQDSVHIVFAGEKVRPEHALPAPDVSRSVKPQDFRVIALNDLVRMKLTSYRRKDQVHILDMLGAGLINSTWVDRYPPELAARLQLLIDTPDD